MLFICPTGCWPCPPSLRCLRAFESAVLGIAASTRSAHSPVTVGLRSGHFACVCPRSTLKASPSSRRLVFAPRRGTVGPSAAPVHRPVINPSSLRLSSSLPLCSGSSGLDFYLIRQGTRRPRRHRPTDLRGRFPPPSRRLPWAPRCRPCCPTQVPTPGR